MRANQPENIKNMLANAITTRESLLKQARALEQASTHLVFGIPGSLDDAYIWRQGKSDILDVPALATMLDGQRPAKPIAVYALPFGHHRMVDSVPDYRQLLIGLLLKAPSDVGGIVLAAASTSSGRTYPHLDYEQAARLRDAGIVFLYDPDGIFGERVMFPDGFSIVDQQEFHRTVQAGDLGYPMRREWRCLCAPEDNELELCRKVAWLHRFDGLLLDLSDKLGYYNIRLPHDPSDLSSRGKIEPGVGWFAKMFPELIDTEDCLALGNVTDALEARMKIRDMPYLLDYKWEQDDDPRVMAVRRQAEVLRTITTAICESFLSFGITMNSSDENKLAHVLAMMDVNGAAASLLAGVPAEDVFV